MEPFLPHILIAEREFLIALDAEYLIKAALDCRITLVRPDQLDQWDETALADVDLCLFTVPFDTARMRPRIERLLEAQVPLLFTMVADIHLLGVEGLEVIPVVRKPYDGETLVSLVRGQLRQRPQPSGRTDQN